MVLATNIHVVSPSNHFLYPSNFKIQNSELSSKPLGKEDWRRNVDTFQTNLTRHEGLNEAPEGQVKTSFMRR